MCTNRSLGRPHRPPDQGFAPFSLGFAPCGAVGNRRTWLRGNGRARRDFHPDRRALARPASAARIGSVPPQGTREPPAALGRRIGGVDRGPTGRRGPANGTRPRLRENGLPRRPRLAPAPLPVQLRQETGHDRPQILDQLNQCVFRLLACELPGPPRRNRHRARGTNHPTAVAARVIGHTEPWCTGRFSLRLTTPLSGCLGRPPCSGYGQAAAGRRRHTPASPRPRRRAALRAGPERCAPRPHSARAAAARHAPGAGHQPPDGPVAPRARVT